MNTMRISGIASGLDTESIVSQLIKADSARLYKLMRQETTFQWRQEAYTTVNKNLANFILNSRKNFGLTQITTFGTVRESSLNSLNWVKKASVSNESVLTATARADAMSGTYKIEVKELAAVASKLSGDLRKPDIDLVDENGILKEEISLELKNGEGKIATVTVASGRSISELASLITNAKDDDGTSLGLRASYDAGSGRLLVSTRETGSNASFTISDGVGGVGNTELIFGPDANGVTAVGQDAKIILNEDEGNPITNSKNTFTLFGLELNLKAAAPGEKITINVDTDVDSIYNKISEFVESYNSMLDEVNGLLNQKVYRDYTALIQDEKDAMSEKEIELWEEKAKSGLLANDETLTRMLQTLRSSLYEKVDASGDYTHISQVGITTGNYRDGGRLVIDETKLRDAIANDPEGVMELFFKVPTVTTEGAERTQTAGLVQRVYDGMISGMKSIISKSGPGEDSNLYRSIQSNMLIDFVTTQGSISNIDRDLTSLNSRIYREQSLLAQKETRYWAQFTAMEKAISEMNSQSSWLTSQLGGL